MRIRTRTRTRRAVPRPPKRLGRRAPKKPITGKALEGLEALLAKSSGKARSRAGSAGKGKAGFALLAGVAGLALRNRGRLTSRFGHKHDDRPEEPSFTNAAETKPIAPTVGEGNTPAVESGDATEEASVPPGSEHSDQTTV